MPATISILYPRTSTSTFDLEYYLSSHMPLVSKTWSSHGLRSWRVVELAKDAPYSVHASMEWDDVESFHRALAGPETKGIAEDVKNYSSEAPVQLVGSVVGSSS